MSTRNSMKYVQPFSEGLSRLLENSAGKYGPTLAISHFLPLYIPSLHNSDFGGSFTELFNKNFNISVSGIECEPIWLPSDTIRYEYVATAQNKISSIVKVSNVPVSGSVSTNATNAIWENTCIKNDNSYSLSMVSGGIAGVDGWLFENEQSFYDYSTKLNINNLFPVKDYEAFTGSDNTVCGRYIVGFKDIADKIGVQKDSEQYNNIYNSKFVYNAVVLYGFKIDNVVENSDGTLSYNFLETPYPVAIAGIEGQPIALNMDSMNNTGSEWDSVWNIDINFVPFDAGSGISNITHRIVSENSYWTKNNSTTIHTNNKMHVGLTVEPYGNTDTDSKHSAWLHISNKNIDPEQFNPRSVDRRHMRLDSSNTFTTVEHKDTFDNNGVIEIKTYGIDNYQTGLNVDLDSSPFIQVHGASAYGEQDIAIGPGTKHIKTKRAVSIGNNITVSGNIDNIFTIGSGVKNINESTEKLGNVINIGNNGFTSGKNILKIGDENSSTDMVSAECVINIGDGNSNYESLKDSIVVGNNNSFDYNINGADHTVGVGLIIIGDGNYTSTKDGEDNSSLKYGKIIGNKNRITSIEKDVLNFSVNGSLVEVDNNSSDLANLCIVGDNVKIVATGDGNVMSCGSGIVATVNKNVKIFGNDVKLNLSECTQVFGDKFTAYGNTLNVFSNGNNNTLGKVVWSKTTLDDSTARNGTNILIHGNNVDAAGGTNVFVLGDTINGGDNTNTVIVGSKLRYNTIKQSFISAVDINVDGVRNSVIAGENVKSYGVNSFQKNLTILGNSMSAGENIQFSANNNSYTNLGFYYSGINTIAVGKNIDLLDSYNGVYVGSDIKNFGGQGMAIGNNITLHAGSTLTYGKIYAIGSNISFGKNGGTVPRFNGPSSVMIFGEYFNSNDYTDTVNFDTNSNYSTLPVAFFANNNYGNRSFQTTTTMSNYNVKIGKFVQSNSVYYDGGADVCDGSINWKCPWGGYTGLSNATDIRVNLPVLEQKLVFGNPVSPARSVLNYFQGGNSTFDNLLFVDENGYVRQSTSYHRTNYTLDLTSTISTYFTTAVMGDFLGATSFANMLNSIIDFFNVNQATKNSNHIHVTQYKQDYINNILNNYLQNVESKFLVLKNAIVDMHNYLYSAYRGSLLTVSTHTATDHTRSTFTQSSLLVLDPGVNGTKWNTLVSTYMALVYHINNSIIIGTDSKHKHLPCTVSRIPFGTMGG